MKKDTMALQDLVVWSKLQLNNTLCTQAACKSCATFVLSEHNEDSRKAVTSLGREGGQLDMPHAGQDFGGK